MKCTVSKVFTTPRLRKMFLRSSKGCDRVFFVTGLQQWQRMLSTSLPFPAALRKESNLETVIETVAEQCNTPESKRLLHPSSYQALAKAAFGEYGNRLRVLQVYGEMEDAGLPLSIHQYNYLLHVFGQRKADMNISRQIYQQMLSENIEPDKYTFASLINSYAQAGRARQAYLVFVDCLERDIDLDAVVYGTVLRGIAKNGLIDETAALVKKCQQQGLKLHPHFLVRTARSAYGRNHTQVANTILSVLSADADWTNTAAVDELEYATMKGDSKRGESALKRLLSDVSQCTDRAFGSWIMTCGSVDNLALAKRGWILAMEQLSEEVSVRFVCNAYLTVLMRHSKENPQQVIRDAQKVLQYMRTRGVAPNKKTRNICFLGKPNQRVNDQSC